jgi:hypothetical protein
MAVNLYANQAPQQVGNQSMQGQSSVDEIMWASAQSSALSKIKMLHSMAKSINDQQ